MTPLQGNTIYLRALEPEDLEFVYAIENDTSIWEVSNTQTPYSKFLIRQYLENAHQDIYQAKQLRLAICKNEDGQTVGLIDLFEYDPRNNRAGVGIIIQKEHDRKQGFGNEALGLIIGFAFSQLNLHQLFANIGLKNEASLQLFANFGFRQVGVKKDWNVIDGHYQDEALYQLINNK